MSPRALRRAAVVAAVVASAALGSAQAPVVRTILANGTTQSRYDMVILGDGYQAAEQARFDQDVNTFLTGLFQKQPYATFASYYNVHTVFRASQDSGASHPDATPPIVRNTAYGASYNTGGTARCLYINNTSLALQDAALAPANEGRVLVMVNDSRYGGCAATFAVSYNGSSMVDVQSHELGHSLASLADEYDYPNGTYAGGEPGAVNITANASGQKWSHWWGVESVSAFEGAGYYRFGLYRPKNNCLMRSLGITLCPVCREQIAKATNAVADVIENVSPAGTQVTITRPATQQFSFTTFVPAGNNPTIAWSLDGQPIAGQTGTSFVFDPATTPPGMHTLVVSVTDHTTFVRNDPGNVMTETHTWSVRVVDPSSLDLGIEAFSSSLVFVQQGTPIVLTTTVANAGPASATDVLVEHFASADNVLDPATDVYLGGVRIPSLGGGQSTPVARPIDLPNQLEPRVWFLFAVVDRENAVPETLETNNVRTSAVVLQAGACPVALEYRDALTWPKDAASIDRIAGGTALPTVIAPCAQPGTNYLLVFGIHGTQPGTPLGGITVPLNADGWTQIGLAGLNGAVFRQFFGPLDAQGFGRATFAWPASPSLTAFSGHFAAILLDATGFAAATNPVSIELR